LAATPKADAERNFAGRWIAELDASEKWQREWVVRSQNIIKRYREERQADQTTDPQFRRYAILWSIQQTLQPATYMRTPQPVVSRRFRDADPVAKVASDVLERAIAFSMDQDDFQGCMLQCRDDFLLLGRGQTWAKYEPKVASPRQRTDAASRDEGVQVTNDAPDGGQNAEEGYEQAKCDHLAYDDWGMEPCRAWDETSYVWRRVYLSRRQLEERFPDCGKVVPLDWKPKNSDGKPDPEGEATQKAAIYEIWNKPTGEVIWLSKAYPTKVLDRVPDPLGMPHFFPCPRPAMGTTPPDKYIPVPDYVYYQDQAEELDVLTERIGEFSVAMKLVGFYPGEYNVDLQNLFQGANQTLVPIDSFSTLTEKGGLKSIVEWLPLDMVATTLKEAFETRQQIKNDVYEITGISDLLRGMSDPDATAKAEGIKEAWGSLRVRDRQKEMARFARDALELKAAIIAKHFSIETLKQMTGVKLLTNQEKQEAQEALQGHQRLAQQSQQLRVQPPPLPPAVVEALPLLEQPSWEDVDSLLKSDALRAFRIDVETDSTIEVNEREAKESLVEGVTAMMQVMTGAGPIVQSAPYTAPIFAEVMKEITRVYRMSAAMEEIVEKVFDQAAQQPPAQEAGPAGPTPQELQLQQMETQGKLQVEGAKLQTEQQRTQMEGQLGMAQLQLDQQRLGLDAQKLQIDAAALQRDPNPQSVS
jgi:hypothetical protein